MKLAAQKELAAKAYELLKDVPEEKWIEGDFTNEIDSCCAIGHYARLTSENENDYREENCGAISEGPLINLHTAHTNSIAHVNDGLVSEYDQATPKQRVLAFLENVANAKSE